jgi:PAS domain S-box-containing protein
LAPDPKLDVEPKNKSKIVSELDARHERISILAADKAMRIEDPGQSCISPRILSTLVSNIPGMIYRFHEDNGGRMEYVSDGCLELTGYRPSDLVMNHTVAYHDLIHRDDRESVLAGIRDAMRNDQPFKLVYRIQDAKGREKWVWEQGRGTRPDKGEPVVRDGFIMDITARVQAERKLEEDWKQAELYVDLMGHDINNMNQVALGFLELALEKVERNGRLDAEDKILLEKPFETLKSNSRLIDSVRKIRREKSGQNQLVLVDLGRILCEVKRQFTGISSREITISYTPTEGHYVMANELLLDVFLNLAGNAVKHSSGPIAISLLLEGEQRQDGKFYRVSVEDNGPGIPDDLKKKLLDEACLKRSRRMGKGFGLCLTRTLLESFNGSIWVENRVPFDHTKGSRFVVLLPAAEK